MKVVGLFFGGMGNEAEISILSARNIIKNFDCKRYGLVLIYWHNNGKFFRVEGLEHIKSLSVRREISSGDFTDIFDIALPITHGRYGEDGVLQSIFELEKIRYCGCKVLSSALCMDKAMFKNFFACRKINQAKFAFFDLEFIKREALNKIISQVRNEFSLPMFVKPSNSGSSIGMTKVKKHRELAKAIRIASRSDSKILIEEGIRHPREIEVAIVGNDDLLISEPGELVLVKDFYDYDDKYRRNQTGSVIPAPIKRTLAKEIKEIAGEVYRFCDCRGFARIDFFLSEDKIYLNEVNTLPGFTDISMFPLLMQNMGMSYKQLINKIIDLAL